MNKKSSLKKINTNNFLVNYVVRGLMLNPSNNEIMWMINNITDPTLSVTSESSNVVDALGNTLAQFSRAKTAEFSAEQCIFDLSLFASQLGTNKKIANENNIQVIPTFETLLVPVNYFNITDEDGNELMTYDGIFLTDGTEKDTVTIKLKNIPVNTPSIIYKLNDDETLGESMRYNVELVEGSFTYSDGYIQLLKQDVNFNDRYFIIYDYKSIESVSIENNTINAPKVGQFILEVLGCDACNPSELIYAYLIFPNAVLDANVDINFTTEGRHPFTIFARQNICDPDKILFKLIIPE